MSTLSPIHSSTFKQPGEILAGVPYQTYKLETILSQPTSVPVYVRTIVKESIDNLALDGGISSAAIKCDISIYSKVRRIFAIQSKPSFKVTLNGKSIIFHNATRNKTQIALRHTFSVPRTGVVGERAAAGAITAY